MVKVSIIIPVYNGEKCIQKCLDSIINQTFDDYEVIVINDGSTDKTMEILNFYKKNNKIKIFNQENSGIGAARNRGIRESSGEYVTFIDSDDFIDYKYLEVFNNYVGKKDFDMVTGTYNKVINNEVIVWPCNIFKEGNIKTNPQILLSIEYGPCSKFFKRSLLLKNNICFIENKKYEDMPFVCKALLKSNLVGIIKEPYYYYVIHKKSETTTMDERVFDILDILKIVKIDYSKEKYLKSEIDYLLIDKITTYMLQQRYQKKASIRKSFIDAGYDFLDKNIDKWKNNKYYKKTNIIKRFIKNNKVVLKGYCFLYGLFK